ncbi:WSC-domain-containing protein [Ascodesmis nigricans]|uniref:WSC-domain-containing protein n=1 Tax=Ascodesmis nigricans TaxID=341454 RepID=A0A4S2MYE0_9PEZI|nr:WSC-domain-containing protein [Ascodesmis nigricans]
MKFSSGVPALVSAVGLAALTMIPTANAFFRMSCDGPLVRDRADPIVNPGAVAGHLHTVVGGNAFDFTMDGKKSRTSTCTSCAAVQDKSNYWVPDLWVKAKNGSFHPVGHNGMLIYYLQRIGPNKDELVPFPDDFRMLAGNPMLRSYTNTEAQNAISFACLGGGVPESNSIPNVKCPGGLRAQVFFPSCWDGKNGDSPDHKSHVSYPVGNHEHGACPPSHPKRFISLFFEILFSVKEWDSEWVNGKHPFVFSNGDPTGYGLHGDFLNGWDPATLKEAIKCDASSGRVEDCKVLKLQEPEDRDRCKIAPRVNEPTEGWLPALPGCNPVTYGPASAVVPPVCNAVSNIGPPKSYSSDMSSKGWTYVGCAFDDRNNRIFSERTYSNDMTIEKCIDHCSGKGFSHVGLQYRNECYCGNNINKKFLGSVQCTMDCVGNKNQYCGGSQKLSVYKKGTGSSSPVPTPVQKEPATTTTTAKPATTAKADDGPSAPQCPSKDAAATHCENKANTDSEFCRQYRQIMKI